MSSLREIVAAQRAAESTVSTASSPASAPARTLQIEPEGCERWLVTWAQFVSAHYHERAGKEQLVLRFAEYEIVVDGRRLAPLFADAAAMRLEYIRGQPEPDLAALNGSAPVVTKVQIHSLSRQEGPSANPESS
jgi:hypothetical protein